MKRLQVLGLAVTAALLAVGSAHAAGDKANGRSLVYSGDTGECDDLVGLARGADFLLCEASVGPDDEYIPDLHLTGKQAGEHAERAGVDTLLVTHIPPWVPRDQTFAEAEAAFTGTSKLVSCGDEYEI